MATFGITPVTGYPIPQSDDFPQFIQFQENGIDLGGPDADTVNFANGVTATRGTGESANVITVTAEGGSGEGPITWRAAFASTTLVLGDAGNGIAMDGGTTAVVTVPAHADVAYDTGISILIYWESGVQPTIVGAAGVEVLINPNLEASVARQYGIVSLVNRDVDQWVLAGDLTVAGNIGQGTVTAVGLDMPAEFAVDPYEITESGVFTVTKAPQPANRFWGGPTSGGAAAPSFRPLVEADLPATPQAANEVWAGPISGAAAAPSFRTLVRADIANAQRLVWRDVSGDYTLVLDDAENGIAMNGSVLTIPSNSEVPFPDGTSILLLDDGYGNPISIIGQSGVQVRVRSALQPVTAGENAIVTLVQRGIDVWYLAGDLELS